MIEWVSLVFTSIPFPSHPFSSLPFPSLSYPFLPFSSLPFPSPPFSSLLLPSLSFLQRPLLPNDTMKLGVMLTAQPLLSYILCPKPQMSQPKRVQEIHRDRHWSCDTLTHFSYVICMVTYVLHTKSYIPSLRCLIPNEF